ncbi:helix-turn-helix domain-containing protein [Actinomadura alba]|uniref:XRE family transcriptional regulator n=1 Tax=Actinomadura alba TaxID=406431 RepID=A0ABR7LUU4_9ACTN|nr:helix-turn-helix transcriptional regulator [Actinomadura alba]MBC6468622.1 XRE family transcriptional regulator [Actinomadura alba]
MEVKMMVSAFWSDLAADLEDPEFLRDYVRESVRIATVDSIINALDDARISEGMSKAELARAIGAEPAVVRRLFAAGNSTPNPTLGTLVDLAAAVGLRIRVEPLPDEERQAVTEPLRTGRVAEASIKRLAQLRQTPGRGAVRPA